MNSNRQVLCKGRDLSAPERLFSKSTFSCDGDSYVADPAAYYINLARQPRCLRGPFGAVTLRFRSNIIIHGGDDYDGQHSE